MSRKERKRRQAQAERSAYREMVGRVERGEVDRLYWHGRKRIVRVKALARCLWVNDEGIDRVVTAHSLATDFALAGECRMQSNSVQS